MIILQRTVPLLHKRKKWNNSQQMLNLEDEQTSLMSLITNTQYNLGRVNLEENLRPGHLNL